MSARRIIHHLRRRAEDLERRESILRQAGDMFAPWGIADAVQPGRVDGDAMDRLGGKLYDAADRCGLAACDYSQAMALVPAGTGR